MREDNQTTFLVDIYAVNTPCIQEEVISSFYLWFSIDVPF
jgi:hypothetical protein